MSMISRSLVDAAAYWDDAPAVRHTDLSQLAQGLIGSEILKIAADVRELQAAGKPVLNLTVGDFSPKEFPIPQLLSDATIKALQAGNTNYPPSDGMPELRKAIQQLYEQELGLRYPLSSIIVQSGGRPGILATYMALVNPGNSVIYPLPSWNNNHYCHLVGAQPIEVETRAEDGFLPTAEVIAPHIGKARLVCINSPLNPSGAVLTEDQLRAICELIVEENNRRRQQNRPAVYLLFDQIYWMLTFGDARHYTPPELVPEMAAYTVMVDGISKWCAATGLRLGWTIAPAAVAPSIKDLIAHIGAWAPKPVQLATAELLNAHSALEEYLAHMKTEAQTRLTMLYDGFQSMQAEGLPVECMSPEGAIYLSARLNLIGRDVDGETFATNDAIRRYVLDSAGFAVVPFGAFGFREENGWFRLSVGAVSQKNIEDGLPRLRDAIWRVE
jgi:aspartate aminotransferase